MIVSEFDESAFVAARRVQMNELIRQVRANLDAEMLGLPLPHPVPRLPDYTREDDPCDDWSEPDDEY